MLKNRVFYVLLLIAAAMIFIFTNTYYTLIMLVMCILLPVLSLIMMLISRQELNIMIDAPQTTGKSDAKIICTFENKGKLPVVRVALRLSFENQMTGYSMEKKINASVGGRKSITTELILDKCKVGTILINADKIRVYDIFGLFAFSKQDLPEKMMTIYPDMKEVVVLMDKPAETVGAGSRYSSDKSGQDVSELFALREYTPGDEVRKIHWKLSSKMDRTMVRDFSQPLNYSVFLLLELVKGSEDAVDTQVEIYLALSQALLERGINHNLGWYDAGQDTFFVRELDDFEDLEMTTAEILGSYVSEQPSEALEFYAASGYRNSNNILIYITTDPDLEKISEMEISQRMQTVFIYEDKKIATEAEQAINVTAISAVMSEDGLPEIIL